MKRLHVSLAVADLEKTEAFYSTLLGSEPTMKRENYVQWILDDPGINFVIEQSSGKHGLTHLGVMTSSQQELEEQFARAHATGERVVGEGDAQCCYAKSTKNWVVDPDGIPWETFLTHNRTEDFGVSFVPGVQAMEDAGSHLVSADAQRCC